MALDETDESMYCTGRCTEANEEQEELQVVVGSINNVKIKAVVLAFEKVFPRRRVRVREANVCSGVRDQPYDDDMIKRGAINRALNAATSFQREFGEAAHLSVGIEGGVADVATLAAGCPCEDTLECFAWIAVKSTGGM